MDAPKAHRKTQTGRTKGTREQLNQSFGGGGGARESDFSHHLVEPQADLKPALAPTFREQILEAMGLDRSGLTGRGGQWIGSNTDMIEASKWAADLHLTEAEQLSVVREVIANKTDGPPGSFKFFTQAMQRLAAAKAAPPLEIPTITRNPIGELQDARPQPQRTQREQDGADKFNRIISGALRLHNSR